MSIPITLSVNGKAVSVSVDPRTLLVQLIRECHGLQCGFCTTGMVMSAVDLLKENPKASEDEIREALDGNICRCTGYHNIVKSIQFCQSGAKASA